MWQAASGSYAGARLEEFYVLGGPSEGTPNATILHYPSIYTYVFLSLSLSLSFSLFLSLIMYIHMYIHTYIYMYTHICIMFVVCV